MRRGGNMLCGSSVLLIIMVALMRLIRQWLMRIRVELPICKVTLMQKYMKALAAHNPLIVYPEMLP